MADATRKGDAGSGAAVGAPSIETLSTPKNERRQIVHFRKPQLIGAWAARKKRAQIDRQVLIRAILRKAAASQQIERGRRQHIADRRAAHIERSGPGAQDVYPSLLIGKAVVIEAVRRRSQDGVHGSLAATPKSEASYVKGTTITVRIPN